MDRAEIMDRFQIKQVCLFLSVLHDALLDTTETQSSLESYKKCHYGEGTWTGMGNPGICHLHSLYDVSYFL